MSSTPSPSDSELHLVHPCPALCCKSPRNGVQNFNTGVIQWNNIGLWFGALRINRSPGSHPLH
ncbi:hypothetical protein OUZ56_032060 [Daphnia magna]|uniref:Uncharacterized protein n=1 Tax=Daphnia magna TaxID=35525 RepID=A0ABQ9ZW16_9CRUS|nr:hypothetical protein OUZ56_032060 [Daphnia magna]